MVCFFAFCHESSFAQTDDVFTLSVYFRSGCIHLYEYRADLGMGVNYRMHQADMVLLGGDLFHDNKPSRQSIIKTMKLLK